MTLLANHIVSEALRMGILDSFQVIAWWSQGLTEGVIVQKVTEAVQAHRTQNPGVVPGPNWVP